MQALVDYVQAARLPYGDRPNVAAEGEIVRSLSVGMVNQRPAYGIAHATTHDDLRLLRLLLALLEDPRIEGEPPPFFTSICLNVDYACGLHTDRYNERNAPSYICAVGEFFDGGELWIEKEPELAREQPHALTIDAAERAGVRVDIRHRWYAFHGAALPHMTMPYQGYRVSIVWFCAPLHRCASRDLSRLAALGFRVPRALPLSHMTLPWPYDIFCCSTRRSETIARDTLATLLTDRSVPPSCIKLCVSDEEDAGKYCCLGLRIVVAPGGLPQQRAACVRALPHGSWALFVDDDLTAIVGKSPELPVHELIMLGFLTAARSKSLLWALNTSANAQRLRPCVSQSLGLVNGYFFGIITDAACCNRTPISDRVGGSAEDVERSLRYFAASGNITRLCSWAAVARTYTNPGGLQGYYNTRDARLAARDYVVQALCAEFPMLLRPMPGAPNGCRFVLGNMARRVLGEEGQASAPEEQQDEVQEQSDGADCSVEEGACAQTCAATEDNQVGIKDARQPRVRAAPRRANVRPMPGRPRRVEPTCDVCGKTFARHADRKYHIERAHGDTPPATYPCPSCGKAFRREKDLRVHIRMKRCFSKRGRVWGALQPPPPSEKCRSPSSSPH
jgi:uncharacterized C2H2 Zn-finger protein